MVPGHYDGVSTGDVLAPTPLGRRATLQLAGLPGLLPPGTTVSRPLDDYAQLLERLASPHVTVRS